MRQNPNEEYKRPTTGKMKQAPQDNKLGLDQDEQAMNGNYGMAQTKEEDKSEEMN